MNIHVGHKLDRKRDLVCDAAMRPLHESPADPAHPRRRQAFYGPFGGSFIGAFSSPGGPMLFVNGEQHPFGIRRRGRSASRSTATLTAPCSTACARGRWPSTTPPCGSTRPTAGPDERLDDFYPWLAAKRADQELVAMWTDRTA